jgi:hypothetical protein
MKSLEFRLQAARRRVNAELQTNLFNDRSATFFPQTLRSSVSASVAGANPDSCASSATAIATLFEISRTRSSGGIKRAVRVLQRRKAKFLCRLSTYLASGTT